MNDQAYWVALARFPKFGAVTLTRFSRHFPTMKDAFEASVLDLVDAGVDAKIASRFLQERLHIDPEQEWQKLIRHGVNVMTIMDDAYPDLLKEIHTAPALLFYRGEIPSSEQRHIAVVGSRKATLYGTRVTEEIVGTLARYDIVIVSGMAYGVDACAHKTAIEAEGKTLAVLANGLDEESIYPSRHRDLASRIIASGGAIISEFPIGTPPLKHHFPFRNRIIAGLSHGTLIVEATKRSGTLITAHAALEQNRDVYAVPGPIYSELSEGPNELIKFGATPVTCVQDILGHEATTETESKAPAFVPSNDEERSVYKIMSAIPLHVDDVIRKTGLPPATCSSTLIIMEMKGAVTHEGGKFYTRGA